MTSLLLPELVTEADSIEEVLANVQDALGAVIEVYDDLGRPLPAALPVTGENARSGSKLSLRRNRERSGRRFGNAESRGPDSMRHQPT